MSYDVNVFIEKTIELDEMVNFLRDRGGLTLTRSEDAEDLFLGHCCGVSVSAFGDHGLEDDQGIAFSQYWGEVSFEVAGALLSEDIRRPLCKNLALATSELLTRHFATTTIVVEGVQNLLRTNSAA